MIKPIYAVNRIFIIVLIICCIINEAKAQRKQRSNYIMFNDANFSCLTTATTELLKRYLTSNNNWCTLTNGSKSYYVYKVNAHYPTEITTKGVYTFAKDSMNASSLKIVVSFGRQADNTMYNTQTILKLTPKPQLINFVPTNNGYDSYTVYTNDSINIEVYAHTNKHDTRIIKRAFTNVGNELQALNKSKSTFINTGSLQNNYFKLTPDSAYCSVIQYGKAGQYLATCAYPFTTQGQVFIRIKDETNTSYLGDKKTTPYTYKNVGYHATGKVNYVYETSFLLLDGSYNTPMNCTVEFVFKPTQGSQIIVATKAIVLNRFNRQ